MSAAARENPLFPFVFVGCWNQPGVEEGAHDNATARNAVATAVVTREADIKHIVLGGDNVYPRPKPDGSKNKKHDLGVFDAGLKLYKDSGKNIIGSFGNHNVDTLGHQMKAFELTNTYYSRSFDDNIHLVVLNTNIINDKDTSPAEYDGMLCWFRTTVNNIHESRDQYFVIQHEPYFVARPTKFVELPNADSFLNMMFAYPPIAILCADTHNYQHDIIQQVGDDGAPNSDVPLLHQIIVGTGGANPDAYRKGFTEKVFRDQYLFRQISQPIPSFGYLYVNKTEGGQIQALFKNVIDWPGQVGGRRRTALRLKRRSKGRRGTRRQK